MARQLNEREKRLIVIGAISVVAILALTYGLDGLNHWKGIRASLRSARAQLDEVAIDKKERAGLLSIVPVAETPELEEKQGFLFRERLYEQLKKAGIKTEPLTIMAARRKSGLPYRVLKIKCRAKCKFDQLLAFLSSLPENPYLVGIEELRIECDTKQPAEKRQDVEIDLTVSTFIEQPSATRAR